jgi:hypothetical protein
MSITVADRDGVRISRIVHARSWSARRKIQRGPAGELDGGALARVFVPTARACGLGRPRDLAVACHER